MNDQQIRQQARDRNMAEIALEGEMRKRALDKMKATPFPGERMSEFFRGKAAKIMMKTAPLHYKYDLQSFADVIATDPVYETVTYFQYGVLTSGLEAITPEDLGFTSRKQYKQFILEECLPHIKFWNEQLKKWEDEFKHEILAEARMKAAAMQDKEDFNKQIAKA